jgi:hypothetical protein
MVLRVEAVLGPRERAVHGGQGPEAHGAESIVAAAQAGRVAQSRERAIASAERGRGRAFAFARAGAGAALP